MPDRQANPIDAHHVCPGCRLPVITGIEHQETLWHEDCIAHEIVRDADSMAGIGEPTIEDNLWAFLQSEQGQEVSAAVLLGRRMLPDLVLPLILGSIGGGLIGAGIGFLSGYLIFQDSPWPLGAVLVAALVGTISGMLLATRGIAVVLAEATIDGIGQSLIRRLRPPP